ncbi:MAG: hypothetical protein LBT46_08375 [Planctomycetaceae bacterium]|jgi:hypothetical protein|nr:hypothetical protein [Planctomycetaceae bacterium]
MLFFSASLDYQSAGEQGIILDISVQSEPFLFGLWTFDVQAGKKTLKPAGDWTEICSHRAKQCDYREYDLLLDDDYRLQRFVLLDRKDKVMLLGDTVLYTGTAGSKPPGISYQTVLHYSKKTKYRLLPLALPCGAAANSADSAKFCAAQFCIGGTLTNENSQIVLREQTAGVSLFAPLFFDLDAQRFGRQHFWRHLTVGEDRQRVPDDKAAGYRVQLGKEQFLIYRSLTPPANRTVLGHNLIDDFCFARFSPETGTEPLIAVQGNDG